MLFFFLSEEDIRTIMQHPYQMVCTDGILLGKAHPRAYGSFPRVLGGYVRDGILTIEEAIRKMTSLPAQRFGLGGRGLIKPGFWADITAFDPAKVKDNATFADPVQYPEGIEYVIVNGIVTVDQGVHNGARAGMIHRHTSPILDEKPTAMP
jgi:N-acyl-D-amino-acid deacylase